MSRQKVQANFFLFSRQIAVVQTIPDIFRQHPTISDNLRQGQSISIIIRQSLKDQDRRALNIAFLNWFTSSSLFSQSYCQFK